MKLRLRANTLRLRLTRGEVDLLGQGQLVAEQTQFPDGSILKYVLVPANEFAASLVSTKHGQEIRIEVAATAAQSWASSDQVGLGGDEPLRAGPLEVLIEKDFTCITPREGDVELDTYPNPNAVGAQN